jgi:hypothetical protein
MMMKSMRMRWAGHVAHMGVVRNLFKMLVDTPERMRQLVESYGIILK